MEHKEIKIGGMHCQGCVNNITGLLSAISGVSQVNVSLEAGTAKVSYDPATADVSSFSSVIEEAGFDVL